MPRKAKPTRDEACALHLRARARAAAPGRSDRAERQSAADCAPRRAPERLLERDRLALMLTGRIDGARRALGSSQAGTGFASGNRPSHY